MKVFMGIELNHEDIANLQTSIVVERWDSRTSGRIKRKWLEEFDQNERVKATRYYKLFYDWYLVKGIPQTYRVQNMTQIRFIERLVNFFALV